MDKLYETIVTSKGGRNGRIKSNDGKLDLNVSFPVEMSGTGEGTNPEQLFGAAYASCFEQALLHVADIHKIKVDETSVTAKVGILQDEAGGFNLSLELDAHAACPYSKAVKGNVPVEINLI